MKAIVEEIQVGGVTIAKSLFSACCELKVQHGTNYNRTKLNFTIKLPSGETKSITIRDEDNETVAYGNFEGLPNFLDYSKEVLGK